MADASLALAERRPDDLKKATERLGMEAPTAGQLRSLRFLGLIAPPASAGILMRIRGIVIAIVLVIAVLALGFGIVYGIGSAAGGISVDIAIFYGFVLVLIAVGVMAVIGRRRQKRAQGRARGTDRLGIASTLTRHVCGRYTLATPNPAEVRARFPIGESVDDPAALQRRARRRGARGDDRPRGQSSRRAAPLGARADVGQEAGHGPEDDQRPRRDGRRAGRFPARRSSATAA